MSNSTNIPGTVSVPFEGWFGSDGLWSTVGIKVGTPPQAVVLLVSTLSGQTWVIDAETGCENATNIDPSAPNPPQELCFENSGGVFNNSLSTTYMSLGTHELSARTELGMGGDGFFGIDILQLDSDINVTKQVIASINASESTMGVFGLSTFPDNFKSVGHPIPSLLSSLFNDKIISSTSFGFTQGASYKEKKVDGSLVLGGFDTGRFIPNTPEISFQLEDTGFPYTDLHKLVIDGNSTAGHSTNSGNITNVKVLIDSTTPFLWLPPTLCTLFEDSLSLVWDDKSGLYLLNDTQQDNLLSRNGFVHFTLGDEVDKTITLKIPFPAFALSGGAPFLPVGVESYFPLKRATSPDQFTLGRVFLQETYLRVDFGQGNFTLNQALFDGQGEIVEAATANRTAFNSTNMTSPKAQMESHGLKKTTLEIVVIIVGLVVLFSCICGVRICRRRRRLRVGMRSWRAELADADSAVIRFFRGSLGPIASFNSHGVNEIGGDTPEISELPGRYPSSQEDEIHRNRAELGSSHSRKSLLWFGFKRRDRSAVSQKTVSSDLQRTTEEPGAHRCLSNETSISQRNLRLSRTHDSFTPTSERGQEMRSGAGSLGEEVR